MRFILRNIEVPPEQGDPLLLRHVSRKLSCAPQDVGDMTILRKALDARKKSRIRLVYTVCFTPPCPERFLMLLQDLPELSREELPERKRFEACVTGQRVIIAGMGPAGLFAALRLSEYGVGGIILERGKAVEERELDVRRFWDDGILDPESNVQFGEGGAGTFSDGKLTCRTRTAETPYILENFRAFGADPDICSNAKPHIGTDVLKEIVRRMRSYLISRGFRIRFGHRLSGLGVSGGRVVSAVTQETEFPCDHLILATGHSARDTFEMLEEAGAAMERKPFAMGLRVEHPQELIDRIQFGRSAGSLPAADYALAWNNTGTGRSLYSFCMCPGGTVIAASSEPGGVVTNGMSLHGRDSGRANSALVVNVRPDDFHGNGVLGGIAFQRFWEQTAYAVGGGGYKAPAQNMMNFLSSKGGAALSSYRPGITECGLSEIMPEFITATLKEGIRNFDRKMKGFMTCEATLVGIESRTSAPVRIVRDENLESTSLKGLYPAGEGSGYAGGIMSSALDGIRIADRIVEKIRAHMPATATIS